MTNKNLYLLFILFFTIINISCNTLRSEGNIDVNGMIYDFTNKPVAQCMIALDNSYFGITDINGRFVLPKVPPGNYTLYVYKAGYEKFSEEILIINIEQIIYIRIPSQNQLLDMVDEALTAMNVDFADELIQRAYQVDKNNIEMLFYYATIKFRQQKFIEAIDFLITAKEMGSRDINIDRFLTILRGLVNADN